jgi:hypothetical protein
MRAVPSKETGFVMTQRSDAAKNRVPRSEWQKLHDALRDTEELLQSPLTDRGRIESALERIRQALEINMSERMMGAQISS